MEATATDLSNAAEIQMEDTGEVINEKPVDTRESIFGERAHTPDTDEQSSDVPPAPSQPSDDNTVEDQTPNTDEPDMAKLIEHKTNLERALASERSRIKTLQLQISQQQVPEIKEGFKVLSDSEVEELWDDDPIEAGKYTAKLQNYYRQQDQRREVESQKESLISESIAKISEVVPGIYDEKSDIGAKLTEYAVNNGFDMDTLSALSNPATQVIMPGESTPRLLGSGAVSLVSILNASFSGNKQADEASMRARIEKEVTERVTKELTQKIKASPAAPNLGDLPASSNETTVSTAWKPMSEVELRSLSPDQRERYRRGEAV